MKAKHIGILAMLWTLLLVVIAAGTWLRLDHGYGVRLSTPIGALKTATVSCPGSASSPTKVTAGLGAVSAMSLQNVSATCVQIGGATVTSTTGHAVGLGCASGQTYPLDGKEAYCISSAVGAVSTQLNYGTQ